MDLISLQYGTRTLPRGISQEKRFLNKCGMGSRPVLHPPQKESEAHASICIDFLLRLFCKKKKKYLSDGDLRNQYGTLLNLRNSHRSLSPRTNKNESEMLKHKYLGKGFSVHPFFTFCGLDEL